MTDVSNKVINDYKIRYTAEQKSTFAEFIITSLQMWGYKPYVSSCKKSKNIIVGDIDTADLILTAHYDTPPSECFKFLLPKTKFPNCIIALCQYTSIGVILMIFAYLASYVLPQCNLENCMCWKIIFFYEAMLFIIALIFSTIMARIGVCPPNINNYNDNTSGVVTLIELAYSIHKLKRDNVVLILFDNEEKGCRGSKLFFKQNKTILKDKLLINLDCVGDGDNILFVPNETLRKDTVTTNVIYSLLDTITERKILVKQHCYTIASDHKSFKKVCKTMVITAVKKSKFFNIFYFDKIHTKQDIHLDEANIHLLVALINQFISRKKSLK